MSTNIPSTRLLVPARSSATTKRRGDPGRVTPHRPTSTGSRASAALLRMEPTLPRRHIRVTRYSSATHRGGDSPAALLLMSPGAYDKQVAQRVLSAASGAHERQIAGAIPTQPPQTALIRGSKFRNIYGFLPVAQYFFGQNFFERRFGWCSEVEYAAK